MTESLLPELPRARVHPFDPPPEYDRLRKESPIARFVWPNGVEGWLVTTYDEVRALLSDPRLSINRFQSPPPSLAFGRKPAVLLPRSLVAMDPPEHTPWRRLIVRELTPRWARSMEPRIREITLEYIDQIRQAGPPSDLVPALNLPVPSRVICELLGVPDTDHGFFQKQAEVRSTVGSAPEDVDNATAALHDYLDQLVADKRKSGADDILGRLAVAEIDGERAPHEIVVGMAMLLLIAGHETTSNVIGLGTAMLLANRGLIAELADDERAGALVEEILRLQAIVQYGVVRRATGDIDIAGVHIAAGDWVVSSLLSANRDESRYACPHAVDTSETPAPHLTFGYGIHQCAGQSLARVELRVVLRELFNAFPKLHSTMPVEQLPYRENMFIYGLLKLPVAW
ncbi:MAG TPA: cytochrome P450 [Pseudonocardiaceae bacterium]